MKIDGTMNGETRVNLKEVKSIEQLALLSRKPVPIASAIW
jgi:hypothetical protein